MLLHVPGLHAVCESCWKAAALHNNEAGESPNLSEAAPRLLVGVLVLCVSIKLP